MIQSNSKSNCISVFTLKSLAILTMTLDHVAAILLSPDNSYYLILRLIGRMAFPIFCFLIAEGSFHTKDTKRYGFRLGIFALISELPFNLAFHGTYNYPDRQNVFFTLLIGLAVIALHKALVNFNKGYISFLPLFIGMYTASLMKTDYGAQGVLLIYIFYMARNKTNWKNLLYILGILILSLDSYAFINPLKIFAIFSIIPISMYTGAKGRSLNKYIFYSFYPIHLMLLYFFSQYI